jgi:hypothetical protein
MAEAAYSRLFERTRILLQAVTEAHYDEWVARVKHVMEQ